jgi:uncharacterized protein (DUF2062 family)
MGDLTKERDSLGRGASAADKKHSGLLPERTSVREKIRILFLSDDSPQQIALGMAIGVFLACSPFIGIHTVAALALALVLRASRLAALIGTLVNNPFTMAFFYFFEFEIGSSLLGLAIKVPKDILKNFVELFTIGTKAFLSVMVGFLVVGAVASILAYIVVFWAVVLFKRRRATKKAP